MFHKKKIQTKFLKDKKKSSDIILKEGAIFIADAHENGTNRRDFSSFLKEIEANKINAPQLFLMGDMFDFLSGGAQYALFLYKQELEFLDKIAQSTEVYYLEGNHDFNLSGIFKHVNVISLEKQPFYIKAANLTFALSHGDLHVGFFYKIYTKIIRNKCVVFVLNKLDFGGQITKFVLRSQQNKKICKNIENFEEKITRKIKKYKNCDVVLEGHYHQNQTFTCNNIKYINFASFACDKLFYRFEDFKFKSFKFCM
ncbi:MAG: metallophosphoesterase [Campylobacteraceae bacterium]|jgi:UDP-2,3-diacylglucosamine hydrolase|nr:metallophosphoesterase [Campylobacteraceae bacterium]